MPYDSKILAKLFEYPILEEIKKLKEYYDFDIVSSGKQVKYPDYTICFKESNEVIALDVKSSYRINKDRISGFSLGSYQGSLRDQESVRYSVLPYSQYTKHYCICIIYDKVSSEEDVFPAQNIDVWIREKYMIASDKPGSGNTKNIGSVKAIEDIVNSNGKFAQYGRKLFEEYWMSYVPRQSLEAFLKTYDLK